MKNRAVSFLPPSEERENGPTFADSHVSFSIFVYSNLEKEFKRLNKMWQRRTFALKNLKAAPDEYVVVLKYLKVNSWRRFRESPDNQVLDHMRRECLLEIDDINISIYATDMFFLVPGYVWKRIDDIPWSQPIPSNPPWQEAGLVYYRAER